LCPSLHTRPISQSTSHYSQDTRKYDLKNISLDLRETLLRLSEEDRQHEGGLEAIKGRPLIAVSTSRIFVRTSATEKRYQLLKTE